MTPPAGEGRSAPPGFIEVVSPAGSWRTLPECAAAVGAGLIDHLLGPDGPGAASPGGGRGPIEPIVLAGRAAIGKRPRHGGLAGRLLGRTYLGAGRLLSQARFASVLRSRGVGTPEVLAIGWRRILGPLQRQAIVTRAIEGALNLYEAARRPPRGLSRREVLTRCGALVRAMHDAGFRHADLNVTNLVLARVGDRYEPRVVDLDRGRFLNRIGTMGRAGNLARLLRSYEKWLAVEAPLSAREEIRFLRGYARRDRAMLRKLRSLLRAYRILLGPRRLAWRLLGQGGAPPG